VKSSKGGPTRKDTYTVMVSVDNTPLKAGVFDKMTGGDLDSDEFKYYPGGMVDPISLGGKVNPSNVVVSRIYRLQRDHDMVQKLYQAVGKETGTITRQPMDIEGNVYDGSPIVWTGTLKRVTVPEVDSESSDPGMLELEFTPYGVPVVKG
jgi:hypothetical protein